MGFSGFEIIVRWKNDVGKTGIGIPPAHIKSPADNRERFVKSQAICHDPSKHTELRKQDKRDESCAQAGGLMSGSNTRETNLPESLLAGLSEPRKKLD